MELINKDYVVAEIEKRIKEVSQIEKASYEIGLYDAYKTILSFLDTLEVEEVDLEKEIKEEYLKYRRYGGRDNMLVILNEPQFDKIAKHFIEFGLKALST